MRKKLQMRLTVNSTAENTFVRVRNKWCYVCLIIDLFNREIIGYSAGRKKNAELVYEAFLNSTADLSKICIFHTDRGSEFKNLSSQEKYGIIEER